MKIRAHHTTAGVLALAAFLGAAGASAQAVTPAMPNAQAAPGATNVNPTMGNNGKIMGKIQQVDTDAHHIVLDGGKTYAFPATFDTSKLKEGQNVALTIDPTDPNAVINIAPVD